MLLHDFAILLSCQRTRPRSCSGSEWRQSGHKRRWSCLGWVHASWSWQEENENSQRTTCVQFVCSLPSFAICLVVKNQRHPKTTAATVSTWFYLEQTSGSRAVNKLHVHVIYIPKFKCSRLPVLALVGRPGLSLQECQQVVATCHSIRYHL